MINSKNESTAVFNLSDQNEIIADDWDLYEAINDGYQSEPIDKSDDSLYIALNF